eukprot:c39957_g1_i1.p1 GENE.c39957_g1_i1~~c39957_g1_i1.p1  ORF type:complete len:207 (+),score=23.39 c39957_g1_i1:221-841(+)
MIWIELVRVLALHKQKRVPSQSRIKLDEVLPDLIIKPWPGDSELVISDWVLTDPILTELDIGTPRKSVDPNGLVKHMLDTANDSLSTNSRVISVNQGPRSCKAVEYCACHVSRELEDGISPVLLFCSMKLREQNNMQSIAKQAHTTLDLTKNESNPFQRYAVIYCCVPKAQIRVADLPQGTIVVPFETLEKVMNLFGASCLLNQAR